jgi:L-iditol 2-dehydrogenase
MKALRATSSGSVEVVDVPEPVAGVGEALMRTRVAGICGSDLLDWYVRGKAGTVLGHEVSGSIAAVGDGATGFSVGARVAPHHHAPCLGCDACRAGRYVHCAEWRRSRLDPGGFAELVRIPAGNLARDTARVPDGVSDEAATFVEPLATVVKALSRARLERGQSLLCIGLGPAGQLVVRLARARGGSRVAGSDPAAFRRAAAEAAGADGAIDPSRERLVPAARALTGGRGFDVVLVGPGKREVVREAFDAVADGGTLLLFTMAPRGEEWDAPLHDLYFREVSVVPSYSCGPDDTAESLDAIASGKVRVDDLVSHRFPIERAAEAFARARNPEGAMKVVIEFGGGGGSG